MNKPVVVKDILGPKLILPKQPNHDEFLQVMSKTFAYSSFFGVMGSRKLLVRVWSLLVLICLTAIVILSIWKVIKALAGWASDIIGHRIYWLISNKLAPINLWRSQIITLSYMDMTVLLFVTKFHKNPVYQTAPSRFNQNFECTLFVWRFTIFTILQVSGSVTARFSGTIFYSIATISLILSSRLANSWHEIASFWAGVERVMVVPADRKLKRNVIVVICFMAVFCVFEHSVNMISLIGFDCPKELILKKYLLMSHGFIILREDYTVWAAPLILMSAIATALWTFQDVLIVLLSMGLTSRYQRLNECVAKTSTIEKRQMKWDQKTEALKLYTWRKIREAYVKQAALVRKVDRAIGGMIVLSCFCNFYFICLQLFLGITTGKSLTMIRRLYFVVSLLWLCIRICGVVLSASAINVHSRSALDHIYDCEPHCYNVEMDRLQNQLSKDYVALSGLGFFYLSKTVLLQMISAIITYELVLIQFDADDSTNSITMSNFTNGYDSNVTNESII